MPTMGMRVTISRNRQKTKPMVKRNAMALKLVDRDAGDGWYYILGRLLSLLRFVKRGSVAQGGRKKTRGRGRSVGQLRRAALRNWRERQLLSATLDTGRLQHKAVRSRRCLTVGLKLENRSSEPEELDGEKDREKEQRCAKAGRKGIKCD